MSPLSPYQPSPHKQAENWFRSAQRLVHTDRYEVALAALDRAIALHPTAELYDYRGVVLALINRVEDALESYAQALTRTSQPVLLAQIYFHRGLLYGREQAYDQALLDFARAARLHPTESSYQEARVILEREHAALVSQLPS